MIERERQKVHTSPSWNITNKTSPDIHNNNDAGAKNNSMDILYIFFFTQEALQNLIIGW